MKTYKISVLIKAKDKYTAELKFCEMEREIINDSIIIEELNEVLT